MRTQNKNNERLTLLLKFFFCHFKQSICSLTKVIRCGRIDFTNFVLTLNQEVRSSISEIGVLHHLVGYSFPKLPQSSAPKEKEKRPDVIEYSLVSEAMRFARLSIMLRFSAKRY